MPAATSACSRSDELLAGPRVHTILARRGMARNGRPPAAAAIGPRPAASSPDRATQGSVHRADEQRGAPLPGPAQRQANTERRSDMNVTSVTARPLPAVDPVQAVPPA